MRTIVEPKYIRNVPTWVSKDSGPRFWSPRRRTIMYCRQNLGAARAWNRLHEAFTPTVWTVRPKPEEIEAIIQTVKVRAKMIP